MKTLTEIRLMAEANELTEVTTTAGTNGYPKNLGKAFIGFNSFEEAVKFADKVGGEVQHIKRQNGWDFWEIVGHRAQQFSPDEQAQNMTDDHNIWYSMDYLEMAEQVYQFIEKGNMAGATKLLSEFQEITDAFNNKEEDEEIVVYRGSYYDTIAPTMLYYYDTWHHSIAVTIKNETND